MREIFFFHFERYFEASVENALTIWAILYGGQMLAHIISKPESRFYPVVFTDMSSSSGKPIKFGRIKMVIFFWKMGGNKGFGHL